MQKRRRDLQGDLWCVYIKNIQKCKIHFTFEIECATINVKSTLQNLLVGDTLKNNIEALRKLKEISQQELAEKLEVTRQTISSLENGRYNPSIILAFKIAKFFDKTIEEIFIYEGD